MSRFGSWMLVAFVAVPVIFAGCFQPVYEDTQVPPPVQSSQTEEPDDGQAKIAKALAALSDEDRALAESQKICPVGGGALGSMDTPIKVDLNGRFVFICCQSCEEPLREDPEKYLAKLEKESPEG